MTGLRYALRERPNPDWSCGAASISLYSDGCPAARVADITSHSGRVREADDRRQAYNRPLLDRGHAEQRRITRYGSNSQEASGRASHMALEDGSRRALRRLADSGRLRQGWQAANVLGREAELPVRSGRWEPPPGSAKRPPGHPVRDLTREINDEIDRARLPSVRPSPSTTLALAERRSRPSRTHNSHGCARRARRSARLEMQNRGGRASPPRRRRQGEARSGTRELDEPSYSSRSG
jgi:hypothetical protein